MSGQSDPDDSSVVPFSLFETTIDGLQRLAEEAVEKLNAQLRDRDAKLDEHMTQRDESRAQFARIRAELEAERDRRQAEKDAGFELFDAADKLSMEKADLEAQLRSARELLEDREKKVIHLIDSYDRIDAEHEEMMLLLENERERGRRLHTLNAEIVGTTQALKQALQRLCEKTGLDLNLLLREMAPSEQGS